MDIVATICTLLEKKKEKFSEYEQATQNMLHCELDDLGNYITKRSVLANEIDKITAEIEQLCLKNPKGDLYAKISYAHVNFDMVPPALHPMFELGQQVRSIIARIHKLEPQVMQRLEGQKKEAFQKVKENHNLPKIKKYLSNLGDQPSTGRFTSTKV